MYVLAPIFYLYMKSYNTVLLFAVLQFFYENNKNSNDDSGSLPLLFSFHQNSAKCVDFTLLLQIQ